MPRYLQVFTTTETREDAQRIALAAVEGRLAACAQIIGPITSTYWWESKVQTAEEWQCVLKTREDVYPRLEQLIRELHTYQVPEILATVIDQGNAAYLAWIDQALS